MKYTTALETAEWLVKRLGPHTRRIEIARARARLELAEELFQKS